MNSASKVLVTGAGGRTGKQVVRALLARGADVRAMVRREEAAGEMTGLGVPETVVADFEDIELTEGGDGRLLGGGSHLSAHASR